MRTRRPPRTSAYETGHPSSRSAGSAGAACRVIAVPPRASEHHTTVPKRPIYVYSFALDPEDWRPTDGISWTEMEAPINFSAAAYSPDLNVLVGGGVFGHHARLRIPSSTALTFAGGKAAFSNNGDLFLDGGLIVRGPVVGPSVGERLLAAGDLAPNASSLLIPHNYFSEYRVVRVSIWCMLDRDVSDALGAIRMLVSINDAWNWAGFESLKTTQDSQPFPLWGGSLTHSRGGQTSTVQNSVLVKYNETSNSNYYKGWPIAPADVSAGRLARIRLEIYSLPPDHDKVLMPNYRVANQVVSVDTVTESGDVHIALFRMRVASFFASSASVEASGTPCPPGEEQDDCEECVPAGSFEQGTCAATGCPRDFVRNGCVTAANPRGECVPTGSTALGGCRNGCPTDRPIKNQCGECVPEGPRLDVCLNGCPASAPVRNNCRTPASPAGECVTAGADPNICRNGCPAAAPNMADPRCPTQCSRFDGCPPHLFPIDGCLDGTVCSEVPGVCENECLPGEVEMKDCLDGTRCSRKGECFSGCEPGTAPIEGCVDETVCSADKLCGNRCEPGKWPISGCTDETTCAGPLRRCNNGCLPDEYAITGCADETRCTPRRDFCLNGCKPGEMKIQCANATGVRRWECTKTGLCEPGCRIVLECPHPLIVYVAGRAALRRPPARPPARPLLTRPRRRRAHMGRLAEPLFELFAAMAARPPRQLILYKCREVSVPLSLSPLPYPFVVL
eukprot:tig00000180_g13630.t1